MTNITNFQDILGSANGDKASVLGKFLYLICTRLHSLIFLHCQLCQCD